MNSGINQDTEFSANEWLRYTRHVQLPEIGAAGQLKLKRSHILVVGAGGLGSPVSLYLAAAGVGKITIVDHDEVDLTNLQRQILFRQGDIEHSKARAASAHLSELNGDIHVHPVAEPLNESNAPHLIKAADIVIDCTDNFSTRFLINEICTSFQKPWLSASIRQFSGQISLFTQNTGCFRCLYPNEPRNVEDCNTNGVLGVLPGILGVFQANEAIKFVCGLSTPLEGKIMLVNALTLEFQKMEFKRVKDCPSCGENKAPVLTHNDPAQCNTENTGNTISPSAFDQKKTDAEYLLLDVRTKQEHHCFNLGGLNIPLDQLEMTQESVFKNKRILCYCQSGKRSESATQVLLDKGFEVQSLSGGIVNYLKHQS